MTTMVSQGTCKLFLYLTILLEVLLVHSCEGQSWSIFEKKHVDFPRSQAPNLDAYCNLMIEQRGLNQNKCKPTNSFINAIADTIQNVCKGINAGNRISKDNFPVVECRARGRFPNCNYKSKERNGPVRLGCRDQVPVHFAGMG